MSSNSGDFGPAYYADHLGPIPYERNPHWLNFFSLVADELVRSLRPASVFDAGCAWGFLVEAFRDKGVRAWGADISDFAISQVRPDLAEYCRAASIAEPFPGGPYDLVTCIEVVEHMPPDEARRAVENMARAADCVLFSSTPDDFTEATHINVRPPMYWLSLFAEAGLSPDLGFDASFVAPHAMLLRRQATAASDGALRLFCEVLRHRTDRAAYLNRQTVLERLTSENASLAAAKDRAGALLSASEAARRDAERALLDARRRYVEVTQQLEQAGQRAAEVIASYGGYAESAGQLAAECDALHYHLEVLYASPGGRFLDRYRRWLQAHRERTWVAKYWEPGMLWFLGRLRLSTGAAQAALPAVPARAVLLQPVPASAAPQAVAVPETPVPGTTDYTAWWLTTEPGGETLRMQTDLSGCFSYRPLISVLVPVYRVPPAVLRAMVESVVEQTYRNWELCITMAYPEDRENTAYLQDMASREPRIRLRILAQNEGISGNSNRALELVTGEFTVLLDHDDLLAPPALFEVASLLNQDPGADFIYSDKDLVNEDGTERLQPLFKPRWSPDMMLNANYLTHVCAMRTALIREVGGWRTETDGAQDWDLFLRVIRCATGSIRHIPKVLYHWRQIATSVASGGLRAKPYAAAGQMRTVSDHLAALGVEGATLRHENSNLRVVWPVPADLLVSVIYLGADEGATALAAQTEHPSFEVVVVNESLEAAVQAARGSVLVFVDEAVRPVESSWLRELTGPLQVPGVAMVGAKINDARTGAIRHAGIVFLPDGRFEYFCAGYPDHVFEQFGAAAWYRNWSALSGACFAIRAEAWREAGGLSAPLLHPRPDLHLSLKLTIGKSGRLFYNPYARFTQTREAWFETPLSGDAADSGAAFLRTCFQEDGDPYFHPSLDCRAGRLRYRLPDRSGGTPAGNDYAAESRILVAAFDAPDEKVAHAKAAASGPATGRLETVTWLLPDFNNPFYGGIHTILRFADAFYRRHGVRSSFCVLGRVLEPAIRRRIAAAFPGLAASCTITVLDDVAKVRALPASDAAISTLWTTAYAALEFEQARRKFYFIQDDEALFYPAGSTSALVEATYTFGFHGICNTPALLEGYRARGGDGEYFEPCVDAAVFHDRDRAALREGPPYRLFCYARPGHPRNCFELLSTALRVLKDRFGDELTILTAGAEWDRAAYGLEDVVQHLGLLSYRATGALYRMCDAGLVMMMTRHPSYLPLELMGCGALVVTNRNPDTAWLLRDGENCLLAAPTAVALADRAEAGLREAGLRRRITAQAKQQVDRSYRNWDAATERIYEYMRKLC